MRWDWEEMYHHLWYISNVVAQSSKYFCFLLVKIQSSCLPYLFQKDKKKNIYIISNIVKKTSNL